jgi:hypothetical protein
VQFRNILEQAASTIEFQSTHPALSNTCWQPNGKLTCCPIANPVKQMEDVMKKLIGIAMLLIMALAPITAFAQSENQVVIFPGFQDEVTVTTEDELVLGIGWGACTPGLVQAWTGVADYYWSMDGDLILSPKEAKAYWGPVESRGPNPYCLIGAGNLWASSWRYSIGSLPVGDYEINLTYGPNHKMTDGADSDEDGKLDFYSHLEASVIVHVLEP